MERLQKVLAKAGIASRRECEILIKKGFVKVNGKVISTLGTKVNPQNDRIEVHEKPIQLERKRTFLFYKPMYVITSMSDPRGRKVVADYFHKIPERVYPAGRLDFDTEGLLLMTNDGELAHQLMHPRYEVDKCYIATVKGKPSKEKLMQLEEGIQLEDGLTAPAKASIIKTDMKTSQTQLKLIIHEGRNRQIRRMCQAIGHPVIRLIRTRIAFLTLDGLSTGQYRELSKDELGQLKKILM